MVRERPDVTQHMVRERASQLYIPEQSVPLASRVGICPLAPYSRLLPTAENIKQLTAIDYVSTVELLQSRHQWDRSVYEISAGF